MPNHITNEIKFCNALDNDIDKIKAYVKSDRSEFDFNKLIPMPESLNIEESSRMEFYMRVYKAHEAGKAISKEDTELINDIVEHSEKTVEDIIAMGKQYVDNENNYGHHTWYSWSLANWGTKWNAYDIVWSGKKVKFLTAWDGVPTVVKKLSNTFPTITIEYSFADEDFGNNVGVYNMVNGDIVDTHFPKPYTNEAFELAAHIISNTTPRDFGYIFDVSQNKWVIRNKDW